MKPAAAISDRRASEIVDADFVIYRLEEAGGTLLALPGAALVDALRLIGMDVVKAAMESYGWECRPSPLPTTERFKRMTEAFAWLSKMPMNRYVLIRVVAARALTHPVTGRHLYSWSRLGKALGADHKAVQRWHEAGIDLIVRGLRP